MPIDKLTPRQLDSDADNKTISKVSMLDALNLYSGPDNDSLTVLEGKLTKSDAGNGILKNIKGNERVSEMPELNDGLRVIGGVEDKKTRITYIFFYHQNASMQGVFAYDSEGLLPGSNGPTLRKIYTSPQFNFPQNGFVKADIVYSAATRTFDLGEDFEKDVIIYFTDGENEPRKINAYRAFEANGSSIHGIDVLDEADFITACPKTPLKPITFVFDSDPDSQDQDARTVNNFSRSPGFQFAYQHIYFDGLESSISSYSDIAILPSVYNQGAEPHVEHPNYRCLLTIPESGPEIETVRLLCRQGNTGSFLIIDEIEAILEPQEYSFFNDRILKGVSTDEVNKQFDSVPRKAKAQAISSNRLMYGNYLDGFNKSETTGVATVVYKDRPEDFISFNVGYIPSIGKSPGYLSAEQKHENLNFFLDFSNIPDSLSAGDQFHFSLSLKAKRNWHLYRSHQDGLGVGTSQTVQRGPQPLAASVDNLKTEVNYAQSFSLYNDQDAAGAEVYNESYAQQSSDGTDNAAAQIWGGPKEDPGDGVGLLGLTWRRLDTPEEFTGQAVANVTQTVRFGTSATNPFILHGGTCNFGFSLEITSNINNAKSVIALAANQVLSNPTLEGVDLINACQGIKVLTTSTTSTPSFDLGLQGGSRIQQNFVGQGNGAIPKTNSDKIVALWGDDSSAETGVPTGYFIVNKADPTFALYPSELNPSTGAVSTDYAAYLNDILDIDPAHVASLGIHLYSLENVEVLTCVHDPGEGNLQTTENEDWLVLDDEVIELFTEGNDDFGQGAAAWANSIGYQMEGSFGTTPSGIDDIASFKGYGNQVGKLLLEEPTDGNRYSGLLEDNTIFFFGSSYQLNFNNGDNNNNIVPQGYEPSQIISKVSLMDGEGGVGGGPAKGFVDSTHPYDFFRMYLQGSVTVNPFIPPGANYRQYYNTVFYAGSITPVGGSEGNNAESLGRVTILPFLRYNYNMAGSTASWAVSHDYVYNIPESEGGEGDELLGASVNFKRNQCTPGLSALNTDIISQAETYGNAAQSFKTAADHSFGIVYYDERGRHGFVDYLDTAFVKTYAERENKGAACIEIELSGEPPEWAHTYKIVYSKNHTVQDFVQYTAGGAFPIGQSDDTGSASDNIYVSLNHLQGHPISYVSSFGARTPEGGLNLYKYEPGDELHVISFGDGDDREYVNHVFDVVELVNLGDTDNPLANSPVPENKKGQFVVLKDNQFAAGFSFEAVSGGDAFNNWSKNCVFELRTPRKKADAKEQLYYELSESYNIVKQPTFEGGSLLVHETPTVTLTKGDVWFRPVATNLRNLNLGSFVDLIPDDDGDDVDPKPNFKNVYLESETATDLFKADSYSIGRPNVIFEDASETIRENTITYSDPSNPESTKLRYSSFNSSLANFKDLSETFGGIQYMGDHGDFVVVIQRDNVSLVPVGKNILSDASGNQQIIASRNVLNEAVVYPGRSGCDIDPSSVFDSGTEVFFANKNLGEVYRWSKNAGPQVISDIGVSSVLRAIFKKAVELNLNITSPNESRIVGGWDPFKKEYLLSVVDVKTESTIDVAFADQPNADVIAPGDASGGGGGDTNGPSGLTVSPTNIDFGALEAGNSTTNVVNIVNNNSDPINITSVISSNSTYSVSDSSFVVDESFDLTVNALALEEGEQNGTLELNTENLDQPRITLSITGNATNVLPPSVEGLLPFTVAYNEYYNESKKDEDMSTEIAKQYIIDRTDDASDPLKINQLQALMGTGYTNTEGLNNSLIRSARLDTDYNGNVGTADLTNFFAVFGTDYDPSSSILSPPDPLASAKSTANQPKPKPTTEFKNPQGAINYLIAQGAMTVGEYLQLRSFLRQEVALNLDQSGGVAIVDLIAFLQNFGAVTENSEPAFLPNNQGGIPVGITAQEVINWLIADGTMTISQYFSLAQYVRIECKADSNQSNSLTTADLLTFLPLLEGGPQYGEEGYGPNDPAFQF